MGLRRSAAAERRWRRFVVAAMTNPFTLPGLGGAILGAVALGIHLGESSIGLINPIYFQGPAVHPRERGAAIDEPASPPSAPAYGQLYGWEQGRVAQAADCGDCEALRARDAYAYSAEVPYFGSREELRASDLRERVAIHRGDRLEVVAPAQEVVVEPKSPVLRYAYYPIEEPVEEPLEPAAPPLDKLAQE